MVAKLSIAGLYCENQFSIIPKNFFKKLLELLFIVLLSKNYLTSVVRAYDLLSIAFLLIISFVIDTICYMIDLAAYFAILLVLSPIF